MNPLKHAAAFTLLLAAAGPLTAATPTDGRLHPVRLAAQAGPAGAGLALTVGLAPDDGDPATCGTATELAVRVGDAVNFCYVVTNTSATTLAYQTLDDSVDGNVFTLLPQTIAPGESYRYNRVVVATASATHVATWTAQDVAPGYVWSAGPYAFVDIRATGTPLDTRDDGNAIVTIPFEFPFYGRTSHQLDIGNNGGILFGDQTVSLAAAEEPLPYPFMGAAILPFWDDLYDSSGNVYWQVLGDAPNRAVVVQWNRPHFSYPNPSPENIDVEAILREDGTISFEYESTVFGDPNNPGVDDGGSATVGLQDTAGASANQYSFDAPSLSGGSAIDWSVAVPIAYTATAAATLEVGLPPTLTATPDPLTASAPPGGGAVDAPLTIANVGDAPLHWSVLEAPGSAGVAPRPPAASAVRHAPPQTSRSYKQRAQANAALAAQMRSAAPSAVPTRVAGVPGCDASTPDLVIHDDGVPENGYGTQSASVAAVTFVDKFTPASYPATLARACVSLLSATGATSQDLEVVVFDDQGDDGGPGNELGAVAATVTTLPGQLEAAFFSVDLSGLALDVASGSVYVGVRYDPTQPGGTYVAADESAGTARAGGYVKFAMTDGSGDWSPIGASFGSYRALLVRAVVEPDYCASPSDVPWLSLDLAGGVVDAHASEVLTATMDPSQLGDGYYAATLCLASDDPNHPRVTVPVGFTVGTVAAAAQVTPASLDLAARSGDAASAALEIANAGTPGSHLDYTIVASDRGCSAPGGADWLSAAPASGDVVDGGDATIAVTADGYGLAARTYAATLCIATNDAANAQIEVPVTFTVSAPERVFADGFDGQGRPVDLVLDDGSVEDGVTYNQSFIWFNRFTPDPTELPLSLAEVQVYWDSSKGVATGQRFDVYVYTDADHDPNDGATLVAAATGQSVTTVDAFQTVELPRPITIARDAGDVLIAIVNRDGMDVGGYQEFPAVIDESASRGRSWIGVYADGAPDIPPVLPATGSFGTIEDVSSGSISGNWLIRGIGVTTAGVPAVIE